MKKFLSFALLALSSFAGNALAVSVQVQSFNQLFACGTYGCGGVFTGMIGGTTDSNGNLTGGQVVPLMCIDFQNDTNIPSVVYNANVSTLTDGSSVSNLRFGSAPNPDPVLGTWTFNTTSINYGSGQTLVLASDNSNAADVLRRYQMIAYLASNYNAPGANNNDLQRAIWSLNATTPPGTYVNIATNGSDTLLSSAAAWLMEPGNAESRNNLLAGFRVVTNVSAVISGSYPAQVQEFLSVVPEPAHYAALLALGLALLFWSSKRMKTAL